MLQLLTPHTRRPLFLPLSLVLLLSLLLLVSGQVPVKNYNCIPCLITSCPPSLNVTLYVPNYFSLSALQVCSSLNAALAAKAQQTLPGAACGNATLAATCDLWWALSQPSAPYLSLYTCSGTTQQSGGGLNWIDAIMTFGTNFTRNYNNGLVDLTYPSICQADLACTAPPLNNTLASLGYCGTPVKALTLYGAQLNNYGFSNASYSTPTCVLCHIGACDSYGYNIDAYLGAWGNLSVPQVCAVAQTSAYARIAGISTAQSPSAQQQCELMEIFRHDCGVWVEISAAGTNDVVCSLSYIDRGVENNDPQFLAECEAELACLNSSISSALQAHDYCLGSGAEATGYWAAGLIGLTIEPNNTNCYFCTVNSCSVTLAIQAQSASAAKTQCAAINQQLGVLEANTVSSPCLANATQLACGGLQFVAVTEYGCDVNTIGQSTSYYDNPAVFQQQCQQLASTCLTSSVSSSLVSSGGCNGYNQFIQALITANYPSPGSSSTGNASHLSYQHNSLLLLLTIMLLLILITPIL